MLPNTLAPEISPPPARKSSSSKANEHIPTTTQKISANPNSASKDGPSLAAIEAGEAQIRDHLAYFSHHLYQASRQTPPDFPRITVPNFQALYARNQHTQGHHFVIHQHDHPISGVHYDLRLQFSGTSTVSFAVPYGLPGNPNSLRPNRMAIETRVHNLWNNLVESASHSTGSLLIWDTGEYEVLPYRELVKARTTDDELSDSDASKEETCLSESEKLFVGFRSRHLRLRLHGTKLPKNYTISLRLPSANDHNEQPKKPARKRRRVSPSKAAGLAAATAPPSTDSERDTDADTPGSEGEPPKGSDTNTDTQAEDAAMASEIEDEDSAIRSNNAYTGAVNTIGSVHQRHWFLSLDRKNCGFRKARSGPDEGRWVGERGSFLVLGRDVERSVVSGRSAEEVMADEGVDMFRGRKMWRPIVE